ncbi:phosphonate ABC transporter, permease protein PhnE [Arthrobacter sp. MMS18-M83]|uniref:phosphonate ABC transporter, permease protein PhnE n=1 Tax=Arthrobacter sp. MMS18-M83 TaxID=2996261 RepID=UPI00227CAF9E|nr:phosphonate ABC transporter, permease protein PhnE [Arthrobacter sp. MMS18-M83]WAH98794.1 phosphonate ABC transporter, permease protein PhnE [Arthrobacter sp. MMS18-M83]
MTVTLTPQGPAPHEPDPMGPASPGPAPRRNAWTRRYWTRLSMTVILAALVLAGLGSFQLLDFSGARLSRTIPAAERFFARMVPLDFSRPEELLWLTVLTLAIVICGTLLSAVLSVPVAYWAARNTSPHPAFRWLGRSITVLARAFPELILIIILATMFSLGSLPGILALGLHSVGMVGKLFADAIEQIDEGPRLAIRAAGGTKAQEFVSGVLPQVAPSWVATVLHRQDINLRASAILGYVGMPGLGYELSASIQRLDYKRAMAVALIIFLLCVAMEVLSSTIRRMVLRGGATRERRRWTGPALGWTVAAVIGAAVVVAAPTWSDFLTVWTVLPQRLASFLPLSIGEYTWPQILGMLGQTLAIALAGTFIGVFLSVLIGSYAARNVAPSQGIRRGARLVLLVVRGIPELILAIVLILVTGLGGAAAALALGIGTVGLLGKLLADSIEEVDPGPERSLRAAGASRPQTYASATFPQAAPAFAGHIFYALDGNIRAATVLAVVGAGGLGQVMFEAAQLSRYNVVFTMALLVIAMVLLVEALAMWIRKALAD